MNYDFLSEHLRAKKVSENKKVGIFEFEGLFAGHGITLGNAIRRVLLSSVPGAAITQVKIKGVDHEFSAVDGIKEDMLELTLNLKKVRFAFHAEEPQVLTLKIKGEKKVTAADIKGNAQVEVVSPEVHIATLTTKSSELDMELTVEKGLGYVPVEARKLGKLPIKTIALDAAFSPVIKVNFEVENMRLGERTNYNRLRLIIETDASISPSSALRKACRILSDHIEKMSSIEVVETEKAVKEKPKSAAKAKKK